MAEVRNESETVRKPRILCLHGFRTSGKILEKMISRWPENVLSELDLVFADAPYPAEGKSGVEGNYDPPFFEWFQSDQEFKEFYHFEECLNYLEDYMLKHGPFDGVLGFSQGAYLASVLPGMQKNGVALTKVPNIKFLILISGGKFGGSRIGLPKIDADVFSSPIECPSLHIIGELDFLKDDGESLLSCFVDPIVIYHPKGHTVPKLMMEQQLTNSKDDNVDEMKSVPLGPDPDPDHKDPSPVRVPGPDPKSDGGALKPEGGNVDINIRGNSSDVDLKEKNSRAEDNNIEPATEGLKAKKSVRWSEELVMESPNPRDVDRGSSNPYVDYSAAPSADSSSFNFKETMGSVKDVLGRWGKKVGEATRKAEDLAGNTWQHLKTSPSLTDAALGRIAQGTKVLAEGGYDKIFRQTFETVPEEQLKDSFACYLSTSAGPVMGVLYVSTAKIAFCSDNPLSYQSGNKTEWSYYKVVIPLHQLKAVNPSTSRTNAAEKYIQVISVDNHEFWYMGFLNYNGAVESLFKCLEARDEQTEV